MNPDQMARELDGVCRQHGGACAWYAPYGLFYAKRDRQSGRDLLLRYKKEVFAALFTRRNNKAALVEKLRKVLPEGALSQGITVDYGTRRSKSLGGVVVRFRLTDVAAADFAEKIDEVGRALETIMARLNAVNAFTIQ